MKKIQLTTLFFLFLLLPVTVFAKEAKIIVVGTGEYGDCTLIESNGEYLLVDTCESDNTKFGVLEFLSEYLKDKEIKSLDILISHYHADHLNALYRNIGIFYNEEWNNNAKPGGKYYFFTSKIKKIYLPNPNYLKAYYDTTKGNKYYDDYYSYIKTTAEKLGIQVLSAWSDTSNGNINHFTFGDVVVDIIGPVGITCTSNCGHEYDDAAGFHGGAIGHYINDHSLTTRFTIGNVKYLSAGDIESSVEVKEKVSSNNLGNYQEEKLVSSKCNELKSDIFKLSHHGLETSNSKAFLHCVNPKFAFYSKDNEVYATAVKPQIDQILYSWRYHINMFTTIDESNGGNGTFAFHIKDNHIDVEKFNYSDYYSTKMYDVNINYVDSNTNETISTSKTYYSSTFGKYYYLNDYIKTIDGYIYDFKKNSSFAADGDITKNIDVNIYYNPTSYKIKNNYIKGIGATTIGSDLIRDINFDTNNNALLYRGDKTFARNNIIKTGDKLKYTFNSNDNTYTLIVNGDVLKNGYLSKDGAKIIANHIVNGNVLKGNEILLAADYNEDGNIKMNDVTRLLKNMKSGWVNEKSGYYYYEKDGKMITGWLDLNYKGTDSKFYFGPSGKMLTGWNVIDNYLYYFSANGIMLKQLDNYSFDEKGYLIIGSGWHEYDGDKYYSTDDNKFVTGWKQIGDNWYYFDDYGKMQTGWKELLLYGKYSWFYLDTDGKMTIGWKKINDNWYYFGSDGIMTTGWKKIDDNWYYLLSDGVMVTEWHKINGDWYYFDSDGKMVSNKCIDIKSSQFCFNSSGVCTSGSGC